MKNKVLVKNIKARIPLLIFLTVYFIFSFTFYKDYGITFDERDVYLRGKLFYISVRGNDSVLKKDFRNPGKNNEMGFYNNVYPALLYQFNHTESFEKYHLLNLLFASFLFVCVFELLLAEIKNPWIALLGPLFVVFTPRFFGDIPTNPKDVPFAIFYFLSLSAIYFSDKLTFFKQLLLLSFIFGLTQSNRIVGYSIYPVYVLFELSKLRKHSLLHRKKEIRSLILKTMLILSFGFILHVLSVPYLASHPILHFIELLKQSSKYPWNLNVLFLGKEYTAHNQPWFSIPVWFIITTPLFILTPLIFGLFELKNASRLKTLFFISLIVNILLLIIVKPVIYDGVRHILYIIIQFVVLSSFFVSRYFIMKKNKVKKILICLFLFFGMVLVLISYINLHPYQYVYFNELIGGVKGAYKKFDLDYWGASNKEAVLWVKKGIAEKRANQITVAVCGNAFSAEYFFGKDMKLVENKAHADYVICWERFNEHKKLDGIIIHSVKRMGVPFVHIYKVKK